MVECGAMRLAPAFVLVAVAGCVTPGPASPPNTAPDRDGDGILDSSDQCPDLPEDFDGFRDDDGCPDPDNDQDGIADAVDKCPNEPEDKDGFQDDDGCPDPDNDGDGIPDANDKCPNEPETFNGFEDEDGCPDHGKVVVTSSNPPIVQRVVFKAGSATWEPSSQGVIDAVGQVLGQHPEILLVQLEGHTDAKEAKGAAALQLATSRAEAVRKHLIGKGVDPSRLRAKGFGPHCPLGDAALDRRVDFKLVRMKDGPAKAELGCSAATAAGVVSDPP